MNKKVRSTIATSLIVSVCLGLLVLDVYFNDHPDQLARIKEDHPLLFPSNFWVGLAFTLLPVLVAIVILALRARRKKGTSGSEETD